MSEPAPVEEAFDVGRIRCQSCERMIGTVLAELEGVTDVRADHRSGVVTVSYEPDVVNRSRVVAELTDLGYRPRV